MTDRAISDVVSYIMVLALILAAVGIVSTAGFATIEDRQDSEQVNNVERAFDVFDNNMKDIYVRGAPSRATEMRLSGGTLRYGERVNITVEDQETGANVTAQPRPLIYSNHGTEIVYTSGAVIRTDGDSSVMLNEPPFRFEDDRSILLLVETSRPSDQSSTSGQGTVRVTSTSRSINGTVPTSLREPDDGVIITVESPRADAWERYFQSHGDVTRNGNEVSVELDPEQVTATRFRIRLRFVR